MSKGDRLHVQIRELHRRGTVRKSMANTHDQTGPQHWCLTRFCRELIEPWQKIARNTHQEWGVCSELLVRTDPASKLDMPLNVFAGRIDGSGRVTLSTLHSAKGREFDAVIMFGINAQDFPN